jgi:hypothetical protein
MAEHLIHTWKPRRRRPWHLSCVCGWKARTWFLADRKALCRSHLTYDQPPWLTRDQ